MKREKLTMASEKLAKVIEHALLNMDNAAAFLSSVFELIDLVVINDTFQNTVFNGETVVTMLINRYHKHNDIIDLLKLVKRYQANFTAPNRIGMTPLMSVFTVDNCDIKIVKWILNEVDPSADELEKFLNCLDSTDERFALLTARLLATGYCIMDVAKVEQIEALQAKCAELASTNDTLIATVAKCCDELKEKESELECSKMRNQLLVRELSRRNKLIDSLSTGSEEKLSDILNIYTDKESTGEKKIQFDIPKNNDILWNPEKEIQYTIHLGN